MRKSTLILATALLALFLLPGSASAYRFDVDELGASGDVEVTDLDPAKSSTLRVMDGNTEVTRLDSGAGSNSHQVTATVQPGWLIEVYQPGVVGPPGVPPTAKLTVPNVTAAPIAGSASVSGAGPDGWSVQVQRSSSCLGTPELYSALVSGGSWSAGLVTPIHGQDGFSVMALSPTGDTVSTAGTIKVAGDGQCVMVSAVSNSPYPASTPFSLSINGLDSAIPTVRVVLRRGGVVLADQNTGSFALPASAKPSPGDTVDVYRPQGAATPAYSWTIPQISSVYDISSNRMAVDAPAAALIAAAPCRPFACSIEYALYGQVVSNTAAGRTMFTMQAQRTGFIMVARAFLPGDVALAAWQSQDGSKFYSFDSQPGDLTSPTGRLSLSKSIGAAKLAKSGKLKFKLTSSEAGSASSALTIPASKKGKKPVKLGSAKGVVKAGSNTISLKLSKSGKKILKGIGKSGKSPKATLTITLTDAAGNVTTVVKSTTLKASKKR